MSYTGTSLARFLVVVTVGSVLAACGDSGPAEPRLRNLVYCENPDVAEPSCSLAGYSIANDLALRVKLDGCAAMGCHSSDGTASTTWTLDLSGPSVQSALTPLTNVIGVNGDYLVDEFDPDCSDILRKLTTDWGNGQRMPFTPPHWSSDETDCFRSYLHDMTN